MRMHKLRHAPGFLYFGRFPPQCLTCRFQFARNNKLLSRLGIDKTQHSSSRRAKDGRHGVHDHFGQSLGIIWFKDVVNDSEDIRSKAGAVRNIGKVNELRCLGVTRIFGSTEHALGKQDKGEDNVLGGNFRRRVQFLESPIIHVHDGGHFGSIKVQFRHGFLTENLLQTGFNQGNGKVEFFPLLMILPHGHGIADIGIPSQ
mmetsp:Transcript_3767/g.7490  ORF Transcript_3767/g.7490 Transcript_3767/m.7490 type:complete len:201 (+) Transcript_3767:67-669(+)